MTVKSLLSFCLMSCAFAMEDGDPLNVSFTTQASYSDPNEAPDNPYSPFKNTYAQNLENGVEPTYVFPFKGIISGFQYPSGCYLSDTNRNIAPKKLEDLLRKRFPANFVNIYCPNVYIEGHEPFMPNPYASYKEPKFLSNVETLYGLEHTPSYQAKMVWNYQEPVFSQILEAFGKLELPYDVDFCVEYDPFSTSVINKFSQEHDPFTPCVDQDIFMKFCAKTAYGTEAHDRYPLWYTKADQKYGKNVVTQKLKKMDTVFQSVPKNGYEEALIDAMKNICKIYEELLPYSNDHCDGQSALEFYGIRKDLDLNVFYNALIEEQIKKSIPPYMKKMGFTDIELRQVTQSPINGKQNVGLLSFTKPASY